MRKVILEGNGRATIAEVEEPVLRTARDIKIQVKYVSLDPDEHSMFMEPSISLFDNGQIGHEFSGIIVELGEDAAQRGFQVGDHVTGYVWTYCGNCQFCRRGQTHLCSDMHHPSGALADYIVLRDDQVFMLPDTLPLEKGVFTVLVAECMYGVEKAAIRQGGSVLIVGGGAAGQILLQLVKMKGASNITVSEPVPARQALAKDNGADCVVDENERRLLTVGLKTTNYVGYDSIINASSVNVDVQLLQHILAKGGVLVLFACGMDKTDISIGVVEMYMKEQTLTTAYYKSTNLHDAISILPKLNVDALMGKRFPLEQINEAFKTCGERIYPRVIVEI